MRIKVSDGDLIVLKLSGDATHAQQAALRQIFEKWVIARGLQGVEAITVKCEGEIGFSVIVMSVNDIFEEQVLDGKS